MAERRAVYRQTKGLEEIRVAVAWAGREYVDAELVDLSARGAAVSVRGIQGEKPFPDVGSPVTLRFVVPDGNPVTDVVAYVRNERESSGARVLGLEIADWRKLRDQLPAKWFTAFNRRRHYRVDVPRQPPIEVELTLAAGAAITGTMKNVSAGGCLLILDDPGAGTVPGTGEAVQVRFQLPDADFRYEEQAKPLFDGLGTAPNDKKHVVGETGHFVPQTVYIGETLDWLEKYLQPGNR